MITQQAARTIAAVGRQLTAMGGDLFFDLGLREEASGCMLPARICSLAEITEPCFVAWLMHKNAGTRRGFDASPWHIYIQPAGGNRCLTLVDDLRADTIERMQATGFEPALVVETSPDNFQAWLKHDRLLIPAQGTLVAKDIALRFDGDPSSAAYKHYGRLANFTNPKPKYRDEEGRFPFVRLIEASGQIYSRARSYLDPFSASRPAPPPMADTQIPHTSSACLNTTGSLPSIQAFHRSPRYSGDLHRADLAFAVRAVASGASSGWIHHEILAARDLSKKGDLPREIAYAQRTTSKAIALVSHRTTSRSES